MSNLSRWLMIVMAAVIALGTPIAAQPPRLIVSVATSVYDAVEEIAGLYRSAAGVTIAVNAGGSNTLARQIVEGAKVNLFVSADARQMDIVERAGRVVGGTRARLLTNALVVIAPTDSKTTMADVLRGNVARVGLGEPGAVPAGVYGRAWLEHEGAWHRVSPKVVPFPTATAVLTAVGSGRVDAGIVYHTDALGSKRVRVIASVPPKDHPYLDITYPAAVIAGPSEGEARRFLQFLMGPAARAVFDRRGFGKP